MPIITPPRAAPARVNKELTAGFPVSCQASSTAGNELADSPTPAEAKNQSSFTRATRTGSASLITDSLRLYFTRMRGYPRLSRAQEIVLAERVGLLTKHYCQAALGNHFILREVSEGLAAGLESRRLLMRQLTIFRGTSTEFSLQKAAVRQILDRLRPWLDANQADLNWLSTQPLSAPERHQTLRRIRSRTREAAAALAELPLRWEFCRRAEKQLYKQLGAASSPSAELPAGLRGKTLKEQTLRSERSFRRLQAARTKMFRGNWRLAVSVAKQYRSSGVPFLDLIQEGNGGMMRAIDRFRPNLGFRFGTFATYWIKQRVRASAASGQSAANLPPQVRPKLYKVARAAQALFAQGLPAPSSEALAAATGLSSSEIINLRQAGRKPLSLCQEAANPRNPGSKSAKLTDSLPDPGAQPDQQAAQRELCVLVRAALRHLNPKERLFVRASYGMLRRAGAPVDLKTLIQAEGLTNEAARKLIAKGERKLKNVLLKMSPSFGKGR